MRSSLNAQLLLILSLAGCSSPRAPQAPFPAPLPAIPVPAPAPNAPTSWTFGFEPGTVAYRISRTAVIEGGADSSRREISTNSTYESITIQPTGDTLGFTAVIDTFATTTQGAIESAQSAPLPLQLSGVLVGDSLVIAGDSLSEKCSPVSTALVTDVYNLLPRLPDSISSASSWNDSTNLVGCQGSIPTRSQLVHHYKVLGDSTYGGIPVLLLQRTDTIHAEGEGAQQQHRIKIDATGTGIAIYYIDTNAGKVLHLTASQDLDLSVKASGRTSHFRQNVKQEFVLVR